MYLNTCTCVGSRSIAGDGFMLPPQDLVPSTKLTSRGSGALGGVVAIPLARGQESHSFDLGVPHVSTQFEEEDEESEEESVRELQCVLGLHA